MARTKTDPLSRIHIEKAIPLGDLMINRKQASLLLGCSAGVVEELVEDNHLELVGSGDSKLGFIRLDSVLALRGEQPQGTVPRILLMNGITEAVVTDFYNDGSLPDDSILFASMSAKDRLKLPITFLPYHLLSDSNVWLSIGHLAQYLQSNQDVSVIVIPEGLIEDDLFDKLQTMCSDLDIELVALDTDDLELDDDGDVSEPLSDLEHGFTGPQQDDLFSDKLRDEPSSSF